MDMTYTTFFFSFYVFETSFLVSLPNQVMMPIEIIVVDIIKKKRVQMTVDGPRE
jgi:hypothetical protein